MLHWGFFGGRSLSEFIAVATAVQHNLRSRRLCFLVFGETGRTGLEPRVGTDHAALNNERQGQQRNLRRPHLGEDEDDADTKESDSSVGAAAGRWANDLQ